LFAEKNQKQQDSAFALALSPDSPIATGLPFNALVIPPAEATPKTVRVNFGVDPHAISFERLPDGLQHATLECTVQAFSAKGKLVRGVATTVKAALKPETFSKVMQDTFPCQQAIDLARHLLPAAWRSRQSHRPDRHHQCQSGGGFGCAFKALAASKAVHNQ
jgi:hypothetical protein